MTRATALLIVLLSGVLLALGGCAKHDVTSQELSAREYDEALALVPDLVNGLRIYRTCAQCHQPEGWGRSDGSVPQLAGQHRTVIIKQLADIRAGNRDVPIMYPFAAHWRMGGAPAVSDVSGYIDTLEISVYTGKGPGDDLARGRQLYADNCVECHGADGEGNASRHIPRIQSQHFLYLVRQLEWIRNGRRRNADPEMVRKIQGFTANDVRAVADYVSRQEPPALLQAPAGWRNPDFEGNGG